MATPKPDARRQINLDQARERRAAARGEPGELILAGRTFTLPAELPALFLEAIVAERLTDAFSILLGDQAASFWECSPSVEDLSELAEELAALYGVAGGLGNLSASGGSPSSTSGR